MSIISIGDRNSITLLKCRNSTGVQCSQFLVMLDRPVLFIGISYHMFLRYLKISRNDLDVIYIVHVDVKYRIVGIFRG